MSSNLPIRPWKEALQALVQRNGAVAVALDDAQDAASSTIHCRLLEIGRDDSLLIERPVSEIADAVLAAGTFVRVIVNHHGQRWESRRRVLGEERFELNDVTQVVGVRLSPARQVVSGQRRAFFRASAGVADVEVSLLPETSDGGPPKPMKLTTVNLSGGGVGVRLLASRDLLAWLAVNRQYRCRLALPGESRPMELRARLIHIEPMPDRACYLGLEFLFDNDVHRKQVQDQLARLTTELQRQQLRRQRRA